MSKAVTIIKSESWMQSDTAEQDEILNDAIIEFVDDDERIINIQMVDEGGLKRFWIFTTKS